MATIEHSSIPNSDLHEPKGVSGATSGDVYIADGAGSGAWGPPNSADGFKYGSIYSDHSDAVVVSSIGTTAKKMEAFSSDAPSNGVSPDSTNHKLTVDTAGDYGILFSMAFATSGSGSAGTFQFHIRINDVETAIGVHREMSGTGDTGSGAAHGILTLAVNDVITVWVESDEAAGTDSIDIDNIHMTALLLKAS